MGLVELLSKTVEEVKHDNTLLLWDARSASEIVERCASMRKKYDDLSEEFKDTMDSFKLNKLYLLVFASNKFEGSKISLGETMRLLHSWGTKGEHDIQAELDRTPHQEKRGDPPIRREVLQHFLAAQHLGERPPFPLTEEIIKREHKVLMAGLLDGDGRDIDAGQYRTEDISAQGHLFIPPKYVSSSMKNLVNDFNALAKDGLDTYMLAGWLMAEFVTIHPFNDGNGRMCRLLLNYVFRLRGLPFYCPVTVTKKQRGHYMTVLKNYQKWPYGENARRKYGMLYAFIASVVESDWENFSTNLETIRGIGEIAASTT